MIPSDFIVTHAPMHLRLEIRKKCNFFWLRDIRDVDISQCCAKCFIGEKDNRVYYGTLQKSSAVVDIIVKQSPRAKAYYLCGLSEGFVWELNTHVAVVPDSGNQSAGRLDWWHRCGHRRDQPQTRLRYGRFCHRRRAARQGPV